MILTKSLEDPVFGGVIQDIRSDLLYRIEYADTRTRDYTISVFQNPELVRADGTELHLVSLKSERKSARKDLNLEAFDTGDELRFEFQYCTRLFKKETIATFSQYFKEALSTTIEDPEKKIKDIDILPKEEKIKIYEEIQKAQQNIDADFDI